jgi:hypothetical protein
MKPYSEDLLRPSIVRAPSKVGCPSPQLLVSSA